MTMKMTNEITQTQTQTHRHTSSRSNHLDTLNKSFLILVIEAMVRRGGAALSILFCNEDCSLVHTSVLVTDGSGRDGEKREGERSGRGG